MDMPYIGAAFRRTRSKINEVELVILVRPELVEAMDPEQVPSCLPGNASMAPDDCGLYWKGYFETPVQMPGGGTMQGSDGQPTPAPAVEEVVPPAPAGTQRKRAARGKSLSAIVRPMNSRPPRLAGIRSHRWHAPSPTTRLTRKHGKAASRQMPILPLRDSSGRSVMT